MEGTNIKYKDTSRNNDHTYIGNGCPNDWDSTDGTNKGGSPVSCSTNLAETYDSETQIIGVYYNYPASASGSSIGISGENIVVPDSFCPLGWQLPYSGTGGDYYDKSKSLAYLNGRYGYSSSAHGAQGMRSYPFSYILSGTYVNYIGTLFFLDRAGDYWSNTYISPSTGAAGLNLYPISFNTTRGEDLAVGYTVRCVKFLASFIDGTVAGNPEDLRIYKETPGEYATHDHTYFGNGCATGNGSITPCAT
ncbi:hypothetical protein IKE07_01270, partial [Candidatus Saccharibacteria bacterium]|nr:hypothetical protein [Candidatus Saccharibacteria bacterium]